MLCIITITVDELSTFPKSSSDLKNLRKAKVWSNRFIKPLTKLFGEV